MINAFSRSALSFLCLATFLPFAARAEDQPTLAPSPCWNNETPCTNCGAPCSSEDDRQLLIKFSPYFWLTQMHGEIGIKGANAPVDVSFGRMWNLDFHDLDFAFLGQLEATYGRLGFLANGAFFELSPGTHIRHLDFNSRVSETALDLDFTYTLFGTPDTRCGPDHFKFDLLAGIRYYSLTGDLSITGPLGNTISDSGAVAWSDLVLGGRFQIPVNESWTLLARGDFGGFGINGCSQAAWNVELFAVYHCSEHCDLFAGWRWLDVDYSKGPGQFKYDVRTDGPIMGLTVRF